MNRLADERSPYLRQHRDNPVDWRPYGPEAFAAAKDADKPVFLSIGYAACHWCHVMAHESFEDEGAAAVLNDAFVNVKVDREERPDVDDVYMSAVQLSTGHGGWPMSVFLLPDGRPFLARTYLRRDDLVATTQRIATLWHAERDRLEEAAEALADAIRSHAQGPNLPPFAGSDADLIALAVRDSIASFDRERGGFDRRPKFPPHAHLLGFLDAPSSLSGGAEMARVTLDAMAHGGIFDHVGGGFHRYSTDAEWLLPHFEKMLYDNALLATAYARASAAFTEPRFADVAHAVLAWVERELAVDGGGYASSLDADTEGEEGLTYTWTPDEVRAVLSPGDAALFVEVYGLRDGGNFLEESTGRATGRSIPHLREPLAATATRLGRPLAALEVDLARIRLALREVRDRRAQPARDDKVLTAWNGLLLSALSLAGRFLDTPRYLDAARALARFLWDHARDDAGRLLRFPRASGPPIPGFLDDHVHLADGLLDLADATGEASWRTQAHTLADEFVTRFADPNGGFFSTSDAHERLLTRTKDAFDSPIPSANATAVRVLVRLGVHLPAADRTLAAYRPLVVRAPGGTMAMVRALSDRAALDAPPTSGDVTVREGPLVVNAFLERGEARPGTTVQALLRVTLDPGWHVQPAALPLSDRVPTTLSMDTPSPVTQGPVRFPAHVVAPPAPGAEPVPMLSDTFDVVVPLQVPADAPLGPRRVTLRLDAQPCNASTCLAPVSVRIDLPLRFEAKDAPPRHPSLFR